MKGKLSKFEGLKCILVCQVSTREDIVIKLGSSSLII